jgi:hypothetical protein
MLNLLKNHIRSTDRYGPMKAEGCHGERISGRADAAICLSLATKGTGYLLTNNQSSHHRIVEPLLKEIAD